MPDYTYNVMCRAMLAIVKEFWPTIKGGPTESGQAMVGLGLGCLQR